jgi:hypothetical protein
MAKQTLYITGVPGLTEVYHPLLAYSEVMLAMREGKMLVETAGSPSAREFLPAPSEAKIKLNTDTPIQVGPGSSMTTADLVPEQFIIEIKY